MDLHWLREPGKRQRENILATSRQVLATAGRAARAFTPG
jgi:hypothetical protein